MPEIAFHSAEGWPAAERERVARIIEAARPVLGTLLGPAAPAAWSVRRTSVDPAFSEVSFRTGEILLDAGADGGEILHELAHAWAGTDLRYDVLEEGLALAASGLACERLGIDEALAAPMAMGEGLLRALAMDPSAPVDAFPPLNMFRYAVLRAPWIAEERRSPGTLRRLVAAFRDLDRLTASIGEYGSCLRARAPSVFEGLDRSLFAPHRELFRARVVAPSALPYLVWGMVLPARRLRIVAGAKRPTLLRDGPRAVPAFVDIPRTADARVVIDGPKGTVDMPVRVPDGAVELDLAGLPAGTYAGRLMAADGAVMDRLDFFFS